MAFYLVAKEHTTTKGKKSGGFSNGPGNAPLLVVILQHEG
jgi:hypothetical protein